MDLVNGDRVRAFRAADALAVETYRVLAAASGSASGSLVAAIRRTALRSGGALVAAAASNGGPGAQRHLERAWEQLAEGRYYLYLARRLGLLDAKGYRGLTTRHEAATREIEALLRAGNDPPPARSP
jgi:hypothetical protein